MSAEVGWTILAGAVMVVGLCGVVIPVLPGLTLIWLTGLGYGFAVGFDAAAIVIMFVLSVLLTISIIKSFIVPRRAAIGSGASGWAQLGGVVGAVIGFFLLPVVGIMVGALAGVLVVEYLLKGDWGDAWTATKGLAKGFGVGVLIDLALGLMMIGAWASWAATVVF